MMRAISGRLVICVGLIAGFVLSACGSDDDGFEWSDEYAVSDGGGAVIGGGGGAGTSSIVQVDRTCPDSAATGVDYRSTDPSECERISLTCASGSFPFRTTCGCGCVVRDAWCPDEAAPEVNYLGQTAAACAANPPVCLPGQEAFDDECGCGCVTRNPDLCDPDALFPRPGETFGAEQPCGFIVVCAASEPDDALRSTVAAAYATAACDASPHPSCPAESPSACVGSLPVLAPADVSAACRLAQRSSVVSVGCSASP